MNTHKSRILSRLLGLMSVFALTASPAWAGGPLILCRDGQPFLWPNGGVAIPFNTDQGPLGPLANAEANQLVRAAFDAWQGVETSTLSYVAGVSLPVDVDVTNFVPFLEPELADGLSPIVYDATGEIFELLFGVDSGVLGFAQPEFGDFASCTLSEGQAFLNGPAFTDLTFALGVLTHEFGHYTNFAHAQVNGGALFGDTNGPSPVNTFPLEPLFDNIETMYPFLARGGGAETLDADDIAIASRMYPSPDFLLRTGAISGRILSADGLPLNGVNVLARNVANPYRDAVSAISGDLGGISRAGAYTLSGLTPGAEYVVYVDEILEGGFSTPPLKPLPGPEEFFNGVREGAVNDLPQDAERLVPVAGSVLADIDVVFNRPAFDPHRSGAPR